MKQVCIIILAVLTLVIIFASSRREGHDLEVSIPATFKANFTPNAGGACPGSPSTGPTAAPVADETTSTSSSSLPPPPAVVAEPEIELDLGLGYPQGTIGTGLLSPGNKRVSIGAEGKSIISTVLGTGQTPTKSPTGTAIAYGLLKYLALPPRAVLFHPP